jgi:predicted Zn finger-like uncharacterized protein
MKFQCDRCKTRYSIADEKVRGKILKIRCKNCAAVITVREEGAVVPRQGAEVSRSGPVLAAAAAPPRAGRGTIELRTIAPPAPLAGAPADEGEPTRIQDPAVAPPVDDWYLATEGEQEGPISLEQARDKVAKKRPEDEMHAWREDFEAWLPIDKVPALAPFLPVERRQPPPLPPPLGQPPPRAGVSLPPPVSLLPAAPIVEDEPDEHDPFAAVPGARMVAAAPPSADDGMDFNIGEASRVVKMPLIARGGGDVFR